MRNLIHGNKNLVIKSPDMHAKSVKRFTWNNTDVRIFWAYCVDYSYRANRIERHAYAVSHSTLIGLYMCSINIKVKASKIYNII